MSLGLSLANTLKGVDINTLTQALEQQQQQVVADAAARAAQSQQGADQAGSAYQAAAAAPPPTLNPLSMLVGGLGADVASILSQNPAYQQQNEQRTQLSQKQLFENRQNTLTALRDKYLKQAEADQQIGNDAAHTEQLEKVAKIENQQAQILKHQEQVYGKELQTQQDAAAKERAQIAAEGRETPDEKLKREQVDNWKGLVTPFLLAGKNPPKLVVDQGIKLGALPEGTTPESFNGGARKPTALEIKNQLSIGGNKNVNVLPPDKYLAQRALRERTTTAKKNTDRKSARENLRNFDLNTRKLDESPEQFIMRLQSIADPLKPKKRLYSDDEIRAARDRTFTPAELE